MDTLKCVRGDTAVLINQLLEHLEEIEKCLAEDFAALS